LFNAVQQLNLKQIRLKEYFNYFNSSQPFVGITTN